MTNLIPGDPAPWFTAASPNNPRFSFHTIAGRVLVLSFFGSAGRPEAMRFLQSMSRGRNVFDGTQAAFFAVSNDPDDKERLAAPIPGARFFWDFDRQVARLYDVAKGDDLPDLTTFVLNMNLRVISVITLTDPEQHAQAVFGVLSRLPVIPPPSPAPLHAPVLIVPYVFEPAFCRQLIDLYTQNGGEDSGFMRDVDGKTVGVVDHNHKRRKDYTIVDEQVRLAAQARLRRRLVPEIRKAYQFEVTRMERHIVACYDAADGGHFRPHRDNTTKGTAHRRFAVTLNLNAEEYEGGELRFPEYGNHLYRAPTGGAVVFSCSLLHEAMPVTQGLRYVFLPFLYDEAAARVREENQHFNAGTVTTRPAVIAESREKVA